MATITIMKLAPDYLIITAIMMIALVLPLNLIAHQPFHHDEALYATWALRIISGQDVWLAHTAIDKPPLFIYTLAFTFKLLGATEITARLPSLVASMLTVMLTYQLGRAWYNRATGMLAAWLVTLSPFTVMLGSTALTDPMLVMFVLASCLMVTKQHPLAAGICMGLALATKQQGLFFLPLIVACYGLTIPSSQYKRPYRFWKPIRSKLTNHASRFTLSFMAIILLIFTWDIHRAPMPSFLTYSATNYGGLHFDINGAAERGRGFIELLQYSTALPNLNLISLLGIMLFLVISTLRNSSTGLSLCHVSKPQLYMDWLLFLFCALFLLGHALVSFQVWDRYLLGLIPLLALLMARLWLMPYLWLKNNGVRTFRFAWGKPKGLHSNYRLHLFYYVILITWLSYLLWLPVQDAVQGRYPLGSHSQALQGIEQIVAYLQGHVGAQNTLYHHWLGTYWRFYLWNYPYDLQYWDTPQMLANKAKPGHFIAFPTWVSDTEARLALAQKGLYLHEVTRAYNERGGPSIILYRLEMRTGLAK